MIGTWEQCQKPTRFDLRAVIFQEFSRRVCFAHHLFHMGQFSCSKKFSGIILQVKQFRKGLYKKQKRQDWDHKAYHDAQVLHNVHVIGQLHNI